MAAYKSVCIRERIDMETDFYDGMLSNIAIHVSQCGRVYTHLVPLAVHINATTYVILLLNAHFNWSKVCVCVTTHKFVVPTYLLTESKI